MARLTIDLTEEEYNQLALLAQIALRSPSNQALHLLRKALGVVATEPDKQPKEKPTNEHP